MLYCFSDDHKNNIKKLERNLTNGSINMGKPFSTFEKISTEWNIFYHKIFFWTSIKYDYEEPFTGNICPIAAVVCTSLNTPL